MFPLPFVLTSSCRYFHEMPWVALDYAQRELKVANGGSGVCGGGSHKSDDAACVAVLLLLCRLFHLPCCPGTSYHANQELLEAAFNVEGIPTLVLIDPKTGACCALLLKLCC